MIWRKIQIGEVEKNIIAEVKSRRAGRKATVGQGGNATRQGRAAHSDGDGKKNRKW